MIGSSRIGTKALGGGIRIDQVRVYAGTAEAITEMGLPWAYNGLIRAEYAMAHADVLQALVRTQPGKLRPLSLRVPSATEKVWNGRKWVPRLVDQWSNEPLEWDGTAWVPPTADRLPVQRVWNGTEWVP